MNQDEAKQLLTSQINVTRQHVVIAKAYIVVNFDEEPLKILSRLIRDMEAGKPEKIIFHPSVPLEPQINQASKNVTWQLAFAEAIWSLIHNGILIPTVSHTQTSQADQTWTTVGPSGGGTTGGWRFEEHEIPVPSKVRLAPSIENNLPQPLSDPDLYLLDFEIPDLHTEVEEALKQAALCFRHELNIPCLAMLAKASEGAWIEMGRSLTRFCESTKCLSATKLLKMQETLDSEYASVIKKMDAIVQLYDQQDIFSEVAKKSGCNHRYLKSVLIWSNVVRDSRNAVHYGADPATQNTYEKVATLLLGAVPNIRVLYSIHRAAEEIASSAK